MPAMTCKMNVQSTRITCHPIVLSSKRRRTRCPKMTGDATVDYPICHSPSLLWSPWTHAEGCRLCDVVVEDLAVVLPPGWCGGHGRWGVPPVPPVWRRWKCGGSGTRRLQSGRQDQGQSPRTRFPGWTPVLTPVPPPVAVVVVQMVTMAVARFESRLTCHHYHLPRAGLG